MQQLGRTWQRSERRSRSWNRHHKPWPNTFKVKAAHPAGRKPASRGAGPKGGGDDVMDAEFEVK